MAKRAPLPKFNTPEGIARYPHLNKPDTRFDDDGVYKCDLILPGSDDATVELVEYLEGLRNARFNEESPKKGTKKIKAPVFEDELDDAGDETGNIIIKTKLNAIGRNKKTKEEWTNEPKLFDSAGNPLASDVQVWSGSRLIVAGTVSAYAMVVESINEKTGKTKKFLKVGVSLKCRGVQVIDLVSGAGQTADSFGFGNSGGGYVGAASEAGLGNQPEAPADDNDEDEGDEDEF